MRKRLAWAALVLAAALASAPASWTKGQHDFELRVLSSPATMVTGGDALVQLEIPRNVPLHKAKLFRERRRHHVDARARTSRPARSPAWSTGLRLGSNTLFADSNGRGNGRPTAELTLVNHPVTGPIFSGPQQQPFVCKTQTQAASGSRRWTIRQASACGCSRRRAIQPPRWWAGARTAPSTRSWTSSTGRPAGQFRPAPAGAAARRTSRRPRRSTAARSPYVVRRERGTINRFIYAIAILAPPGDPAAAPDTSLWNGRLIYTFDGGVAIGHNQGTLGGQRISTTSASRRATRSSTRAERGRRRTTTSSWAPRRRS